MLHDPKQQFEALVTRAVTALRVLPDEERANLLKEMETVVFRRAADAYGLPFGKEFADAFVIVVAARINDADEAEQNGDPPALQ